MSQEDLYIVLEIGRKATVNDIKRAFRRLARQFHPDINPGDRSAEERFKRISDAYDILSDPSKRAFYDENGFYTEVALEPPSASQWNFRFEGFDFSMAGASAFEGFFNTRPESRGPGWGEPRRGEDIEFTLPVGFIDSIRGFRTRITVARRHACPACAGTGQMTGSREETCASCRGIGRVVRARGHLRFAVPCAECRGAGRTVPKCRACGGGGRIAMTDILDLDIPAGVSAGARVRFEGKGDVGSFAGPAGDLYVVTNVAADPFFERAGDNIRCAVPIAVWEAALGAKIRVPTVDGAEQIRIPPGTQDGQVFRLRRRGAPSLRGPGLRGDQFVEVRVVVPKIADERSREILRELARLNPEDPRKDLGI